MKTLRIALVACCFAASAWADDVPAIWKSKCESCHGADGKAQTKTGKKEKIEDMTAADWQTKWTDEKMKTIILEGSKDNTKMKAFKGKISDADVDGLIKHIRSFKG
ncbi:MAG: cytochrome c [Archangiaceae bacterium]|nr:cytochrome c [Archangiaceae bacterium]